VLRRALCFSAFFGASEGLNRLPLDEATLAAGTATWIEIPKRHLEPLEWRAVCCLATAGVREALETADRAPARRGGARPLVVLLDPPAGSIGPMPALDADFIAALAPTGAGRPPAGAAAWHAAGATLWLTGRLGRNARHWERERGPHGATTRAATG
jgi:hypothetical protein